MIPRRLTQQSLLLCVGCILLASISISCDARATFGLTQHPLRQQLLRPTLKSQDSLHLLQILRGGSTAEAADDDEDDEEEDDEETSKEESPLASVMSSQPVRLTIQTNWGNAVMDHRVELMAARTRDVASLKKSLSRQLPGRPPVLSLELVYEGRALDNEMLVDELFDDDDEDDEEDEDESDGEPSKTLILNAVPPVDPKFATELTPKLKPHVEDDDDTLSTEELVDAYYLNQVAMARNSQLLSDPNVQASPVLRLEIQELAKQLREQLQSETPEDVWEASLEPVRRSHTTEERRGQRYRSGKGGARTSLKKSIQHNMNIHWGETIRNCILFLFFGYFGGRNTLSRSLMLWGAPMCFILQARPVKMWSKILFYMMTNPPSVILSLLPAPQQAILAMDMEKSFAALYNPDAEKPTAKAGLKSVTEEDDEESDEEEESDVEESDSESEDDDEESEEEEDEYDSEDED